MIDLRLGDCLEVMKTIKDNSIDAIITDPPYGTTQCKWDSVIDFDLMWEQLNRIIKPNGAIVLFGLFFATIVTLIFMPSLLITVFNLQSKLYERDNNTNGL